MLFLSDLHQKRNNKCPAKYFTNEDGICALCKTARDCGPGAKFTGGLCDTTHDNTCTACSELDSGKPAHAKYGTQTGALTSGTCEFVCTDGYTGDMCQYSNVCAETTLVLADGHGDGWNGAEAHIDALTGSSQWTHVTTTSMVGSGTSVATENQNSMIKATKSVGCLKDGW